MVAQELKDMGIQIQFEPYPDSEVDLKTHRERFLATLKPKARTRAEKRFAKFDAKRAKLEAKSDTVKTDDWEHGVFSFDLANLQALMELVEHDTAHLQCGPYRMRMSLRQHPSREWSFSLDEFYSRLQTRLAEMKSSEEFDWAIFEPVYKAKGMSFGTDVRNLVAWLLENGQAEAWCKACQRNYQIVDVDIYDWTMINDLEGTQYVCPKNHVLLTTTLMIFGALSNLHLSA